MKFFVETYGCQMNVSDSELISSMLINAGHTPAEDIDGADLIIFNTCTVRQHAEDRVLGRISNEKHRKKQKPGLKIGVVGCMAQRLGKDLLNADSGIDFVLGVDQYDKIASIAASETHTDYTDFEATQLYPGVTPHSGSNVNAFTTIMRGCNNFCSYCIVPYVRGRERSRSLPDILHEVRNQAALGRHDVTLLGQNVNSYNADGVDFASLLNELTKIDEVWRIRFVTSHPKDLSDRLIEVMAAHPKICNHIHLPMQSGSNPVLKAMNRAYTAEHYLSLVQKLRAAIPDIAITTDVIAGFPGETSQQFEDTIRMMQEVRFHHSFCFKYSNREGTEACQFNGQVPEHERLQRLQRMIDLQREITEEVFKGFIGKRVEIYVEDISKKSAEMVSGKTRDNKVAVISGTASEIGTLKSGIVTQATSGTLICG